VLRPFGLEDDGRGLSGEHPELLGHQKSVGFVADHDRLHDADPESGVLRLQAVQAAHRVLQHGVLARQRQELFGEGLAREGPEAGSGTAREDHGLH